MERLRAPDLGFGEFAAVRVKLYAGQRWTDTMAEVIADALAIWEGRGSVSRDHAIRTTLTDALKARGGRP